MNREDELLLAEIEDKKRQSADRCMLTHSGFLDMRQKTLVYKTFGCMFWGGYDDAERCVALFLPEYMAAGPGSVGIQVVGPEGNGTQADGPGLSEEDDPLQILRVAAPKGSRALTHRDYLGSLLSLGIDRSVTGDILVHERGADIVVLKSMGEYLRSNYEKAGRASLSCELLPCSAIAAGELRTALKRDTVASLRLDSLVSSAFDMARGKAQEAIRAGLVFADGLQATKPDEQLDEGCKLVLRGKGKAVLKEAGGRTRKDRIGVVWEKYL